MNPSRPTPDAGAMGEAAARWTVRRDRGLSAAEAIEFELWLAADPRHAEAMQRSAGAWSRLDRVPDATAQRHLAAAAGARRRRRYGVAAAWFAAAAAVAVAAIGGWQRWVKSAAPTSLVATGPRAVTLADGTLVRMNEGSEIVERFTAAERNVVLTRGEAHFTVTKNPARPFTVSAGALRVRAVGTAFNVNLQPARVEVLVTEGKVGVERVDPNAQERLEAEPLHVVANELAVAPTTTATIAALPAITVTPVDDAMIARALAWHESLLRLGGATLSEIAAEFERRTGRRVSIPDAALAQLRVGGRFRADDLEGFTHLLATTFDVDVERAADGTLVLRKKSALSP